MRVLIAHNKYRLKGGEDVAVDAETRLLSDQGHEIRHLIVSNDDLDWSQAIAVAWRAAYSNAGRQRMASELEAFRPDIVHIHNFFPILTPAIYDACWDAGIPVVQTLHNYRLLCPKATMFRGKRPCELCLHGSPYQAVLHACYRDSRLQSLVPARMVAVNRRRGTWTRRVTRFITLTEFARRKFIEGGFPADRIDIKSNYAMPETTFEVEASGTCRGALFVGRLSAEKGVQPLVDAWRGLTVPLRIVGDGPMAPLVRQLGNSNVELAGTMPTADVYREMNLSQFLVVPSLAYEGFPIVLAEAFACGLPAIVSRHGSLEEIIEDGVTGLHAEPNDADDLAAKIQWAHDHPAEMRQMGINARKAYERNYTPEVNYSKLIEIYTKATAATPTRTRE